MVFPRKTYLKHLTWAWFRGLRLKAQTLREPVGLDQRQPICLHRHIMPWHTRLYWFLFQTWESVTLELPCLFLILPFHHWWRLFIRILKYGGKTHKPTHGPKPSSTHTISAGILFNIRIRIAAGPTVVLLLGSTLLSSSFYSTLKRNRRAISENIDFSTWERRLSMKNTSLLLCLTRKKNSQEDVICTIMDQRNILFRPVFLGYDYNK